MSADGFNKFLLPEPNSSKYIIEFWRKGACASKQNALAST